MALAGARDARGQQLTSALIEVLAGQASGAAITSTASSALESAVGVVGRAFAAAQVDAPDAMRDALSPACMALIGRSLIRRGEVVFAIRVIDGKVKLWPASSHDVYGGADPDQWVYRVTASGPGELHTFNDLPASGVVHIAYAVDPETPWRGVGPLQVARMAGRLSAETAAALADDIVRPARLPASIAGARR